MDVNDRDPRARCLTIRCSRRAVFGCSLRSHLFDPPAAKLKRSAHGAKLLMTSRFVRLVSSLLLAACGSETPNPWTDGSSYTLTMVADTPRTIHPEIEARLSPISDTARFRLRIDSTRADSVFGVYEGENPHFWPPFWPDVGIRHPLVITRMGSGWLLDLNPRMLDAGMDLRGTTRVLPLRGNWRDRSPGGETGSFSLLPPGTLR